MEKILQMRNITMEYPGVIALNDVTFEVIKGELMALCGENGAGKSTLIKILAGAVEMTSGEIIFKGDKVDIRNPHIAKELGISIIYQELNLNPNLSIAENIFLGQEPIKNGFIDRSKIWQKAKELCESLNMSYDIRTKVRDLSVAQMQMVEIAKALSWNASLIVMDEPTASLTNHEIEALFKTIANLKALGVTIIYISHRLEEVFQIADRVTVLRDGCLIGTELIKNVNKQVLIKMMVGRELQAFENKCRIRGSKVMEVKNLNAGPLVKNINFTSYQNEILGISGLVGSGRTEMVRAILGADKKTKGEIIINGENIKNHSIKNAIKKGIALAPEDRKLQGLILGLDIRKNITIVNLGAVMKAMFINKRMENQAAVKYCDLLRVKTPGVQQLVRNLSGGNQQKVVLAKWLFSRPKVMIFDEPTRGIDVGAKADIYKIMDQLVEDGISVIVISSELPEILQVSDRILVMHEGSIAAEVSCQEADQETILHYSTGTAINKN